MDAPERKYSTALERRGPAQLAAAFPRARFAPGARLRPGGGARDTTLPQHSIERLPCCLHATRVVGQQSRSAPSLQQPSKRPPAWRQANPLRYHRSLAFLAQRAAERAPEPRTSKGLPVGAVTARAMYVQRSLAQYESVRAFCASASFRGKSCQKLASGAHRASVVARAYAFTTREAARNKTEEEEEVHIKTPS